MPPPKPSESRPPAVLVGSAPPSPRRPPSAKAPAPRPGAAPLDEGAALPLLAEAVVLELHEHHAGEAVVELGDVDVARTEAGHAERDPARLAGRKCGQVLVAGEAGQAGRLAEARDPDPAAGEVSRSLRGRHHHAAGAGGG